MLQNLQRELCSDGLRWQYITVALGSKLWSDGFSGLPPARNPDDDEDPNSVDDDNEDPNPDDDEDPNPVDDEEELKIPPPEDVCALGLFNSAIYRNQNSKHRSIHTS